MKKATQGLCWLLLCWLCSAAPLTLAEPTHRDYGVKSKTSINLSRSTLREVYVGNLSNNYTIHGGTQTQLTLAHNMVYMPRSDLEFVIAGNGSYKEKENIGFVRYKQEDSFSLNNFWVGTSYISPFFDALSPVMNLRMGSLQNATSNFIALSFTMRLTQRGNLESTFERHFYQLNPREFGWRSSSDNYSIATISMEYAYEVNPYLELSWLMIRRGSGGSNTASNRYLLSVKRLF